MRNKILRSVVNYDEQQFKWMLMYTRLKSICSAYLIQRDKLTIKDIILTMKGIKQDNYPSQLYYF